MRKAFSGPARRRWIPALSGRDIPNVTAVLHGYFPVMSLGVGSIIIFIISFCMTDISYTFIKLFSGKANQVSVITYVMSAIFLIKFFLAF